MSQNFSPNTTDLLDALFDFVVTDTSKDYLRIDLGQISAGFDEVISNATNLNLQNFVISVDSYGIRHILNKHGAAENETFRGQKIVEKKSFWYLSQIIDNADAIQIAGKSAIGNDLVLFEKTIGESKYFTIWEIRTVTSAKKQVKKRSRMMLHTFYIR